MKVNLTLQSNTTRKFLDELKELKVKLRSVQFMNEVIIPFGAAVITGTSMFYFSDFSEMVSIHTLFLKMMQLWFYLTVFLLATCVSDPYDTKSFFFRDVDRKKNIKDFYDELNEIYDKELWKL